MNVGETNQFRRRLFMPIYLDDGSALVTDGSAASSPPAGTIKVSVNGAATFNGAGVFAHTTSGQYYYQATISEVSTAGFTAVIFQRTGFRTEIVWAYVGQLFTVGETDAAKLRLPLTMYDDASPPALTTGATASGAQLQVSHEGEPYANAAGTLHEVSLGLYYYQGVAADSATEGTIIVKYEKTGFSTIFSTQEINLLGGSTPGPGSLVSLTPAPGLLDADPETARFRPIVAQIQCQTNELPYVFATVGSLSWTVYDGFQEQVMPLFGDHTTVVDEGAGLFTITVLPNGGWWRSNIDVHFVSGKEMV